MTYKCNYKCPMTARIMTCIVQLHSPTKDEIRVASSQSDWRILLKLWSVHCPLYHIASLYFVSKVNRLLLLYVFVLYAAQVAIMLI